MENLQNIEKILEKRISDFKTFFKITDNSFYPNAHRNMIECGLKEYNENNKTNFSIEFEEISYLENRKTIIEYNIISLKENFSEEKVRELYSVTTAQKIKNSAKQLIKKIGIGKQLYFNF